MDDFDARKRREIANLVFGDDDDESKRDASRAGAVDARAARTVRAVCESANYFTTSSCSGRISVFGDAPVKRDDDAGADADAGAEERKAKGGLWAYVSHDPADAEEVLRAIAEAEAMDGDGGGDGGASTLTLRFEPFILSVEARDVERGAAFVKRARECGYRESGITACEKRVICAARCQIRMEAPVRVGGTRIVDDDGVRALVALANEKFEANARRMERFYEGFQRLVRDEASTAAEAVETSGVALRAVVAKDIAKTVKDALKRRGVLDTSRKSTTRRGDDGAVSAVVLPVKRSARALEDALASSGEDAECISRAVKDGALVFEDDDDADGGLRTVAVRAQNPATAMKREVVEMLKSRGLNERLAQETPARWEKLGDLVLIPAHAFAAADFTAFESELYAMVARVLGASRIARQAPVSRGPKRESRAVMLYPEGANGWVETKELGVTYGLDVTKVMFSSGNGTEKNRMGSVRAQGETVVDLFAGIGYYTLQLLKHAGAAKVYACEWNPNSCAALRHNLRVNNVESKCEVLEGDNRRTAPTGVADRVLLGLLPHAEMSWETAVKALKPRGGVLHVHSNVNSGEEDEWMARLLAELKTLAEANGREDLDFVVEHLERVKWYGPRIRHVVCDVKCTSRAHVGCCKSAPKTSSDAVAEPSAAKPTQPALEGRSSVRRMHRPTPQAFIEGPASQRVPAVLSGLDIGQAPWKWTPSYLAKLGGVADKLVSVHVSDDPKLDFVRKNFKYEVMPFGDLLAKMDDTSDAKYYYLRSIGENPRKEPAHALRQFPSFEEDLTMPTAFWGGEDKYFSAVIRVSSGDLQLWTHYDAMDNMLIQLHGEKRILLFPPAVAGDLYLEGSSSIVRDVDNHDPLVFPRFSRARQAALEVVLQPGDVLYIPALWSHHVTALHGPSIALNVFHRHLSAEQYPAKDLYGNADPTAAALAAKNIDAAMEAMKTLPHDYRVFYAGVHAARLENHLGVDSARRALPSGDADVSDVGINGKTAQTASYLTDASAIITASAIAAGACLMTTLFMKSR